MSIDQEQESRANSSTEVVTELTTSTGRRRSLSFSWILYGHLRISSKPISSPQAPRCHAHPTTKIPPQQPFQNIYHEIRVLHLQPGRWLNPIVCTLEIVPAPYDIPYEALSYTWGSPIATKPILINGIEHHVTRNLEAALRHLRRIDIPRTMWCDAICINQADNDEKSIQVQKMGHIFSGASKVLIWLGQPQEIQDKWILDVDDNLLQSAIDLASNLRQVYQDSWSDDPFHWASLLRKGAKELQLFPADIDGPGKSTALLINLLGRPWFSRVWMIQEANLHPHPTEVVFGHCSSRLNDFTHTAHYLAILEDFFGENYGHPSRDSLFPPFYWQDLQFTISHPTFKALSQAHRLQMLLSMTSACFHCTDARDRVYALLGLMDKQMGQNIITADYNKDFHTVAIDTATALIQSTRSFALLSSAHGTLAGLPSWVPAWNRPAIYARNETYFEDYFATLTDFPGHDSVKFELSSDRTKLSASGIILGHIADILKFPELIMSYEDVDRAAKNIEIFKGVEDDLTKIFSFAKCFEISKCNISILAHVLEGTRFNWTWKEDVQRYDVIMDGLSKSSKPITQLEKVQYLDALALVIKDDVIFSTTQGDIGRTILGPAGSSVLKGDCIALFPGCLRPVILRPLSGGYKFLGQCYLHGYMDLDEQAEAYEKKIAEEGKLDLVTLI